MFWSVTPCGLVSSQNTVTFIFIAVRTSNLIKVSALCFKQNFSIFATLLKNGKLATQAILCTDWLLPFMTEDNKIIDPVTLQLYWNMGYEEHLNKYVQYYWISVLKMLQNVGKCTAHAVLHMVNLLRWWFYLCVLASQKSFQSF